MMNITEKMILELGTLQVFEVSLLSGGIPVTAVYWRDQGSPQGYGPFLDVYTAMKHYEQTVRNFRDARSPSADGKPAGQVIQVDFRNKRRVPN